MKNRIWIFLFFLSYMVLTNCASYTQLNKKNVEVSSENETLPDTSVTKEVPVYLQKMYAEKTRTDKIYALQAKLIREGYNYARAGFGKYLYKGESPEVFIWYIILGISEGIEAKGQRDPFAADNPNSSAAGFTQIIGGTWGDIWAEIDPSLTHPKDVAYTPANQVTASLHLAEKYFRAYRYNNRGEELPIRETVKTICKAWFGGPGNVKNSDNYMPNPGVTNQKYYTLVLNRMDEIAREEGMANIEEFWERTKTGTLKKSDILPEYITKRVKIED